jgi:hypothetical protein
MILNLVLILIILATIATGILAGASLDKAIVQLPARHRIGIIGFTTFSRANDLGNGIIVYPVIGIAAALLNILAAIAALFLGTSIHQAWPLYISAILALLHSFTTTQAAPNMLSIRQLTINEVTLSNTFNRFAAWHNIRAVVQLLNFIMLIFALIIYINKY